MAVRNEPRGMLGALTQVYNYAEPVLSNAGLQKAVWAVTGAATGALGALLTTAGNWAGWEPKGSYSVLGKEIAEAFSGFRRINVTNYTEVRETTADLVQRLLKCERQGNAQAQLYDALREQTAGLLQTANIHNAVKLSMVEAGLNVLPLLNLSNRVERTAALSIWLANARDCHEHKVGAATQISQCETREVKKGTELSSCQTEKKAKGVAMKALRQTKNAQIGNLTQAKDEQIKNLTQTKDAEKETLRQTKNEKIKTLKQEKDAEIKVLNERIADLIAKNGYLKTASAVYSTELKTAENNFNNCENKGFFKRTVCWFT